MTTVGVAAEGEAATVELAVEVAVVLLPFFAFRQDVFLILLLPCALGVGPSPSNCEKLGTRPSKKDARLHSDTNFSMEDANIWPVIFWIIGFRTYELVE